MCWAQDGNKTKQLQKEVKPKQGELVKLNNDVLSFSASFFVYAFSCSFMFRVC